MWKYVFFIAVFSCGGLTFCPTNGAAETKNETYLPLMVGNHWVYESSEGTEGAPVLESWDVVRQEGQSFIMRIQQTFATNASLEEQFVVGDEGVQRQITNTTSPAPLLQLILKVPPVEGMSWLGSDGRYTVTALGESVTVPAGTFPDCVEVQRWRKETQLTEILTYAPGVGIIQREEKFPVIGGMGSDFETLARVHVLLRLREWKIVNRPTLGAQ